PSRREAPAAVEPSAPAEPASDVTAAGLVRRSPRQQVQAAAGGAEPVTRVSASARSPEDVRRLLSRYRTGLQRGRGGDLQPGTAAEAAPHADEAASPSSQPTAPSLAEDTE
ncbi:MAG: hypothetical protein ACKVWR_22410, partial [Acidimicrobiales bacterium]